MTTEPFDLADDDPNYQPFRAALGDVAIPAAARETAIRAALDEFDLVTAGDDDIVSSLPAKADESHAGIVVMLDRRRRWTSIAAGSAAAAMVLVVGLSLLKSNNSGVEVAVNVRDTQISATSAAKTSSSDVPQLPAADAAMVAESAPFASTPVDNSRVAVAAATAGAASPIALSEVTTPDALRQLVKELQATRSTALESTTFATPACSLLPRPLTTVRFQGTIAYIVVASDGTITAVNAATCAILITVTP